MADDLVVTIEEEPDDDVLVSTGEDKPGDKPKTGEEGVDDLVKQVKVAQDRAESEKANRRAAEARAADSEAAARRATADAEEARKTASEREMDSVANALSAAEAEEETAVRELQAAQEAGDAKAIAEANRKIARASTRVVTLQDGKAEMEARRKAPAEERRAAPERPAAADPVETYIGQFKPREQAWLREHRECVTDPKKNTRLIAAHNLAVSDDITPGSDEYFEHLDKFMGYAESDDTKPAPNGSAKITPAAPARRATVPAAPVSRDAGGGGDNLASGEVKLSAREARSAQDGTIVWNHGPDKGKPIGIKEFARRKQAMAKEGYYDPANYGLQ